MKEFTDVQRYMEYTCGITENKQGELVQYSDYHKLLRAYEQLVEKASRYDWLSEHPNASVSVFSGKYRVNIGDYVVTEWCDSRDEAIDQARGIKK